MIAAQFETQEHVVLYDVSWDAYERILDAFGDRRLRHSYNEGVLEIMSPLKRHDRAKKLIARFIEAAALELNVDIQGIGSTTLRREPKEKGLEPDECYYVAHEADVRDKEDYVPDRDPPPDLALEIDVTHTSVDRLAIYAALGVPEVWRWQEEKLTMLRLNEAGSYESIPASVAFPLFSPLVIESFLRRRFEIAENQLVREFIDWLRNEVNMRKSEDS